MKPGSSDENRSLIWIKARGVPSRRWSCLEDGAPTSCGDCGGAPSGALYARGVSR
jgi:hypothetical protein